MVFGSGVKGAACTVAAAAASINPASPIAIMVLGMPSALLGFCVQTITGRIAWELVNTAERA